MSCMGCLDGVWRSIQGSEHNVNVCDAVIIGAGVMGVTCARKLADKGMKVVVLERQAHMGGIWASWANESSCVQDCEPFYRLGCQPGEKHMPKISVLRELAKAAEIGGFAKNMYFNTEVVRVVDNVELPHAQVFYRHVGSFSNSKGSYVVAELRAKNVICCCGDLQNARRVTYPREDEFRGRVVYGISGESDPANLDYKEKKVVVLGMGAFAVENARTALLNGASHVDIVCRRANRVVTRFACGFGMTLDHALARRCDLAAMQPSENNLPIDASKVFSFPYEHAGAMQYMPKTWQQEFDGCGKVDIDEADAPNTNPTVSDAFFIACATGQLTVTVGEVDCFQHDAVVVNGRRVDADLVIKSFGFDSADTDNKIGGVLEVVGYEALKFRPPIWITSRVLNFRNEADLHPLSDEELKHSGELYNFVFAATFTCELWLEIFSYFQARPEDVKQLLRGSLPCVDLSRITLLDLSRGLHVVLTASSELKKRVDLLRQKFNRTFRERYCPEVQLDNEHAWILSFLKENKSDWEDLCKQLTGDPHTVPYVWDDLLRHAACECGGV